MIPTAWDMRSQMHRLSVEHAMRNALAASTALDDEEIDIVEMAIRITQKLIEPRERALILSDTARILSDAGRAEQALWLLLLALQSAQLAGRDTVLEVLGVGAGTLAAVDNGELLVRICHELEAIDSWFGAR